MKKRLLALLMVFTMTMAFVNPRTTQAAWPWWERNKHIVKADAIGALGGIAGGWAGSLIGAAVGSLAAGIDSGQGGSGWEPGEDIKESVGLHHNLALNHVMKDRKLNELGKKEIEEGLLSYVKPFAKDDHQMKIIRMILSGEDVPQIKTSDDFKMNLDMAMKILDEKGNPRDLIKKATAYLRGKSKNIPFNQINAEVEKRTASGMDMDDIAYTIVADVLEHSFDYWGGNKEENMKEETDLVNVKSDISLNIGSNKATINGEVKMMDVMPIIRNNRTLVPFRFIGEAVNAEVNWIAEDKEVTYELDDAKISLFIDKNRIMVNGVEQEIDTEPIIINNRTLVPLRVISETLGFEVEWIPENQEIRVLSK